MPSVRSSKREFSAYKEHRMSALASHQQSKQSAAGSKQIEAIVVDETTVNNITAVDSSINSIYLMPS